MNEGARILLVALLVCGVCSVVVSTTSVSLRPLQERNKQLDRQRNILIAAGLIEPRAPIEVVRREFSKVRPRLVDLEQGRFIEPGELGAIRVEDYELSDMLRNERLHSPLSAKEDIAGIKRRERYALVYWVEQQRERSLILPLRGYGLWSTLYGFVALRDDFNTVIGLGFHTHGETPGLGGEVDNPNWRAQWKGKRIYDENDRSEVAIGLIKGRADDDNPHQIDGLSGATITSRGVSNMLKYWLGESGYGPFLQKLRDGEIRS